jgi:hypothetical protein
MGCQLVTLLKEFKKYKFVDLSIRDGEEVNYLTPEELNDRLVYSTLQDTLVILGSNAILKMNVLLYREGKNNQRQYFYSEAQYMDKNGYLSRMMRRNINTFLTLENIAAVNGVREYIVIRGRDLELLRMFLLPKLETIIQNFNEIFEMRDNKLYLNDIVKPIEITFSSREKTIWLKPGLHKLYSDEVVPCIELYLNSINNMSVLNFSMIYEFMYIIRTFDIYGYASNMISYFGIPPIGYNLYDRTANQIEQIEENKTYNYETQKPLKLKERKKGFFETEIERRNNDETN